MSSGKSVSAAHADSLVDLQRALLAADDLALRASCLALGISAQHCERFTAQAALAVRRANTRVPAATAGEVALALGVLVTLFTPAPAPAELG